MLDFLKCPKNEAIHGDIASDFGGLGTFLQHFPFTIEKKQFHDCLPHAGKKKTWESSIPCLSNDYLTFMYSLGETW